MEKILTIFQKILEDENLTIEFANSKNLEEMYKFCEKIDPTLSEEEFNLGVDNLMNDYTKISKIDDNSLENISGGKNALIRFNAAAIVALTLTGNVGTSFSASAQDVSPIAENKSLIESAKETANIATENIKEKAAQFANWVVQNPSEALGAGVLGVGGLVGLTFSTKKLLNYIFEMKTLDHVKDRIKFLIKNEEYQDLIRMLKSNPKEKLSSKKIALIKEYLIVLDEFAKTAKEIVRKEKSSKLNKKDSILTALSTTIPNAIKRTNRLINKKNVSDSDEKTIKENVIKINEMLKEIIEKLEDAQPQPPEEVPVPVPENTEFKLKEELVRAYAKLKNAEKERAEAKSASIQQEEREVTNAQEEIDELQAEIQRIGNISELENEIQRINAIIREINTRIRELTDPLTPEDLEEIEKFRQYEEKYFFKKWVTKKPEIQKKNLQIYEQLKPEKLKLETSETRKRELETERTRRNFNLQQCNAELVQKQEALRQKQGTLENKKGEKAGKVRTSETQFTEAETAFKQTVRKIKSLSVEHKPAEQLRFLNWHGGNGINSYTNYCYMVATLNNLFFLDSFRERILGSIELMELIYEGTEEEKKEHKELISIREIFKYFSGQETTLDPQQNMSDYLKPLLMEVGHHNKQQSEDEYFVHIYDKCIESLRTLEQKARQNVLPEYEEAIKILNPTIPLRNPEKADKIREATKILNATHTIDTGAEDRIIIKPINDASIVDIIREDSRVHVSGIVIDRVMQKQISPETVVDLVSDSNRENVRQAITTIIAKVKEKNPNFDTVAFYGEGGTEGFKDLNYNDKQAIREQLTTLENAIAQIETENLDIYKIFDLPKSAYILKDNKLIISVSSVGAEASKPKNISETLDLTDVLKYIELYDGDKANQPIKRPKFKLTAMSVHSGYADFKKDSKGKFVSANSGGHWWTYQKSKSTKTWAKLDGGRRTETTWDDIESVLNSPNIRVGTLIYELSKQ